MGRIRWKTKCQLIEEMFDRYKCNARKEFRYL